MTLQKTIEHTILAAGIAAPEIPVFLAWAFGHDYDNANINTWIARWNVRHGAECPIHRDYSILESLFAMVRHYRAECTPDRAHIDALTRAGFTKNANNTWAVIVDPAHPNFHGIDTEEFPPRSIICQIRPTGTSIKNALENLKREHEHRRLISHYALRFINAALEHITPHSTGNPDNPTPPEKKGT